MIPESDLLCAVRWLTYHLDGLPAGQHRLDNEDYFSIQPTSDRKSWQVTRHYRAGWSERGNFNLALEDHLLINEDGFYWQPLEERGSGKSGFLLGDREDAHWKPTAYGRESRYGEAEQSGFALDSILAFLEQYAKSKGALLKPGYEGQ